MKKLLITLASILVIAWVALSVLSLGGENEAERLLYKALKAGQKMAANPDVVPPAVAAQVEKGLLTVLKRYPTSGVAVVAEMKLAEFYVFMKKYDKSIETLDNIIRNQKTNAIVSSQALFLKGGIFEKQNQWSKALAVYGILRDRYEETPLGLQVPIYIADYYARNAKTEEADRAYNDAITFYGRLSTKKKGTAVGYWSSEYLLKAYISIKRYEDAGRVLEEVLNSYPADFSYMQNLGAVEPIFVKQLNKPEKALEIYKSVAQKANDKRLKEMLQDKIEIMEKQK